MNEYSLCQDCLRLNPIHKTNDGICVCGGETCDCNSCRHTISLLQEGCLDNKILGLKSPIEAWTAKDVKENIYKVKEEKSMELTKENLFFCYDFALKNKLKTEGIRFVTTAVSNDQRRFWLYFRTDEVNRVIEHHIKQK